MTAKAAFASQTLAVYISGGELRFLRQYGHVTCELKLDVGGTLDGAVELTVSPAALTELQAMIDTERAAIDAAKAKLPPRPTGPGAKSRRRKALPHD